jgi:hypothetical protein
MLSVASAVVSSGRGVRAIFRIQGDHPSTAAFVAGRPARVLTDLASVVRQ